MESLNLEFINHLFIVLEFEKFICDDNVILTKDSFREFYFLNDLDYIVSQNKYKFELNILKYLYLIRNNLTVLVNETGNNDLKLLQNSFNENLNNFLKNFNETTLVKYNNNFKDIKSLDNINKTRKIEYFENLN